MRIALVTSNEPKGWYDDLHLTAEAVRQLGAIAEVVIWDNIDVDWYRYDIVLIDSTWDYVDRFDEFIEWCKRVSNITRLVNDISIIEQGVNKRYLSMLAASGVRVSEMYIVGKEESVPMPKFAGKDVKTVIKPVIGAGGNDTFMFESEGAALASPAFTNLHMRQDMIVQRFEPAISKGEYGAMYFGGELSHCVLKRPGASDFRVQHDYGGTVELVSEPKELGSCYDKVVHALGYVPAYMRLDFIVTDEPVVMEVEMIEPNKFLRLYPDGAKNLAYAVLKKYE